MDSKNSKLTINASNLHHGGGVQVAVSFLWELLSIDASHFDVVVSTVVDTELKQLGANAAKFGSYQVHDSFGIKAMFDYKLRRLLNSSDVVFTVFGPLYCFLPNTKVVVGFAQPWIIYPENEIFKASNIYTRLKIRIKFFIQKLFYFNSDLLVVEHGHVKKGLEKLSRDLNVEVVHNCVSSVFGGPKSVSQFKNVDDVIKLGYLSRDYPHKNLDIIPSMLRSLKEGYGLTAKFYVTLTYDEWSSKSLTFRENVINVGSLAVEGCPAFYASLDGVVCPSLLECFSATPLEAMLMKRPVFVSDRHFFRDACGDCALYFDPLLPESIADRIFHYFSQAESVQEAATNDSYNHALTFNDPKVRAVAYIDLIRGVL
jgi:glycosyltransferase involved in cell wall biosynthesis